MSGRNILFVSSNFPPVIGGSSVVYEQICRNAADRVIGVGSKLSHETGEPVGDVARHDNACGYVMRRLDYLRPPASDQNKYGSKILNFLLSDFPIMSGAFFYLIFLIVRYRVKVICLGELVYNGWLVFPLRYLLRRRVIIYTHGEELAQDGVYAFAKLRKYFLQHANAIVSVSLFCKSLAISKFGVDPDKIFVITNGIDLAAFCRGVADRGVYPEHIRNKRIVLAVSRLVERKGHRQLIQAMPAILETIPDAHCVIVGDGPMSDRLKATVAEMHLENDVTFLGGVSLQRLVQLYRAADVFVLPCQNLADGDTEGFGLVFLEANACGLPVVAGAAGGTVEAVVDGENGLLVEGTEPRQIADATIRILSDPKLAAQLAEAGWHRAQQCGWHQIAQEFLNVCDGRMRRPDGYGISFPAPIAMARKPRNPKTGSVPKLLMTVDVEEEFVWSEFSRSDFKVRGLEGLSVFHENCRGLGLSPVYILTYTIMNDPDFCRFFNGVVADGSAEVGIHLHSWVTPPYWEHANDFNSYQCNLPAHIERRKLEALSSKYQECFGRPVTIHRAGRWGGAERTSALLEEMGVKVDLSPSTGYSTAATGGPDFRNLTGRPFWSGPRKTVLTIPASSINYLMGPEWVSRMFFAGLKNVPAIRRLAASQRYGQAVRFSPEGQSTELLKNLARQLAVRQLPLAVCSVHSTSLYDGGNPYVEIAGEAGTMIKRSTDLLRYSIETLGFVPTTCAELYAEALSDEKEALSSKAA